MQLPATVQVDESVAGAWFAALTSAAEVRWFQPLLLPGPLQTPEYAVEAIVAYSMPPVSRAEAEEIYGWRTQHQAGVRLEGARFVVAEAALRWPEPAVARAQCRRLAVMEGRVASLRVLPAGVGAVAGMVAPFVLLDGTSLYRELAPGCEVFTRAADQPGLVGAYREAWDRIEAASVPLGAFLTR